MIVLRKRVMKPGLTVSISAPREMQREGTLRVLRLVAVELVEEGGERGRDEVDHVHLQRLRRPVRFDALRTAFSGQVVLR